MVEPDSSWCWWKVKQRAAGTGLGGLGGPSLGADGNISTPGHYQGLVGQSHGHSVLVKVMVLLHSKEKTGGLLIPLSQGAVGGHKNLNFTQQQCWSDKHSTLGFNISLLLEASSSVLSIFQTMFCI